MTNMPKVNIN